MKTYKGLITKLEPNQIFVFGSNPQGIHGAGVALWALKEWGAIYGQGYGLQGRFYGIVTKELRTKGFNRVSVSAQHIIDQILGLYAHADANQHQEFYVAYTAQGKNLNGYTPKEMAIMFSNPLIPDNIIFEEEFSKLLTHQ